MQQDQSAVDADQFAVNNDQSELNGAQNADQSDSFGCSQAQQRVQQDLSQGDDSTSDENQESLICGVAEDDQTRVNTYSQQLANDEQTLQRAQNQLQQDEAG